MGRSARQLRLVEEHALHELLGRKRSTRLEASGVCVHERFLYVVFDDSRNVAKIERRLRSGDRRHRLLPNRTHRVGFEDVTFHPGLARFLCVLEAMDRPKKPGHYRPRIEEYDEKLRFVGDAWVDLDVARANKGIEGLSHVRRGGIDYVLGLWESSRKRARLPVFQKGVKRWERIATLELPKSVRFDDYSCVSVDGDRIAVASQESSAVWIGRLAKGKLAVECKGTTYLFPRSSKGRVRYCNVEGVAWMSPRRLVVVSDRCKKRKQSKRCCERDQSIHVFEIPR